MEDYKKKYEEALERAKEYWNSPRTCFDIDILVEIFPELKEIKDEKIRKDIIAFIKENYSSAKSWVAWLEKQGEQKHTDKVEPKFKVGDWVVLNGNHNSIYQVEKIENYHYVLRHILGGSFPIPFGSENSMRLWTIKDAKDGEVLSYVTDEEDLWIMIYWSLYEPYDGLVHYHALLGNDNFADNGTCCICIDNLKPATKEQRDTLERAMANAGYRWDEDRKELNKL